MASKYPQRRLARGQGDPLREAIDALADFLEGDFESRQCAKGFR
jgi:hypothetical protein